MSADYVPSDRIQKTVHEQLDKYIPNGDDLRYMSIAVKVIVLLDNQNPELSTDECFVVLRLAKTICEAYDEMRREPG